MLVLKISMSRATVDISYAEIPLKTAHIFDLKWTAHLEHQERGNNIGIM